MSNKVRIIDYGPQHQPYFEKLNKAWIEKYFWVEPRDEYVLTKPEEAILKPGGAILIALYDDVVAGTVALKKIDAGTYEFTKMAVDENFHRLGIAEALGHAAINKAKELGAERIILFSHSSLKPALTLYEQKLGFKYVKLDKSNDYVRSDVMMELQLTKMKDLIKIIKADVAHAKDIAVTGRQSFFDAFSPFFNRKEDLKQYLDHTYAEERIEAGIRKANNVFFLALHNGKPVGFAKVKKHSLNPQITSVWQTELQKIYVLQQYHGIGAGQLLMDAVIELAKEVNPEWLWLDVLIQNGKARRFYDKNGFIRIGEHFFTIGSQTFEYDVMARPINQVENINQLLIKTKYHGTDGGHHHKESEAFQD
jgi:GNAT superfamily N-acetyltransferase